MQISMEQFKSKCFALLKLVEETGEEVIVLKDGEPYAKLIPVEE